MPSRKKNVTPEKRRRSQRLAEKKDIGRSGDTSTSEIKGPRKRHPFVHIDSSNECFRVVEPALSNEDAISNYVTRNGRKGNALEFNNSFDLRGVVGAENSAVCQGDSKQLHDDTWNAKLVERYKKIRNIPSLYEWQKKCLSDRNLREGGNLIIAMSTSAGKTLIAEILMLQEVVMKRKSCLFIVPYIAIAGEKVASLSSLEDEFDVYVEEYAASKGRIPPIKRQKRPSIYVATIEKANILINSMIAAERLDNIGIVVVDELHMIGEINRGAIIEQILVKFMEKGNGQIVGMSATLTNIKELARFLRASVFSTAFRPVKLVEKVKIRDTLFYVDIDGNLKFDSDLGENEFGSRDPDGLSYLLKDIIPNKSALIFCPNKQSCENLCRMLARLIPKDVREHKKELREATVNSLLEEQDGCLCSDLEVGLLCGIAYHHSGLTADERRAIECAFQDGTISVICCTSTLAAGVNLPARRVIIKRPLVGREPLRRAQYLQMVGRAGRAGLDTTGDAVTILEPGEQTKQFLEMLKGEQPECRSKLGANEALSSFILDLIALKVACEYTALENIIRRSLFGIQNKGALENFSAVIAYLIAKQLIQIDKVGIYKASGLGEAIHVASLSVSEAQQVSSSLVDNLDKGLVLSSHFHLIFLVVPFSVTIKVDWNSFYEEYKSLDSWEQQLMARMGLCEKRLIKYFVERPELERGEVPIRLYVTYMLNRIWKQEPLVRVAEHFKVERGWLQNVLQLTISQASSIARFSEKVQNLWPLKHLLPQLIQQLRDCAQHELIPLLAIDGVKRARAHQLYDGGFKTVGAVACANPNVLRTTIAHLSMRQASALIRSAKALLRDQLMEKAEELEQIGADPAVLVAQFVAKCSGAIHL